MARHPARSFAIAGLLALVVPAIAGAQTTRPTGYHPEVNLGIVFDDNVYLRPDPTPDVVIRLTPGFTLRHDSPRVNLTTFLRFDAERYQDNPTLNTPAARQATGLDFTVRPLSRLAVSARVGYQRTQTPLDLNLTTGLTGGRQRATRVDGSATIEHLFRPETRLSYGGDLGQDDVLGGVDSQLRRVRARFTHRVGTRSDVAVGYRLEYREFFPGSLVTSQVATIGTTYRPAPSVQVIFEGGPRFTDDTLQPDITVSVIRAVAGASNFMLSYTHTQDVAIGIANLITVDRVWGSITLHPTPRWDVSLAGSAFRNDVTGFDVLAYDMSGSVGRSLTPDIWLIVSASRSLNDNRFQSVTLPDTRILRNWIALSVRVAPRTAR
jgi:hypothetical protein